MNPFVDTEPADAPVVTLADAGPGDPELLIVPAVFQCSKMQQQVPLQQKSPLECGLST